MSKIDELIQSSEFLSKEHQLYKPHHERSVAGFIPEVLAHLSSEVNFGDNIVRNKDMANQIEESFPSGYKQAIVIIADGVGAQHLKKLGGTLADNMETEGTVASTMFPSMTSTVMSSISRGMYPASHGVVGYNLFNEHIGDIWSALAMRYKKEGEDRLVLDDFDISQLISGDSLISSFSNNSQPFIAPEQLGDPSLLDLVIPRIPLLTYPDVESGIKTVMHLIPRGNPFTGLYYPFADHFGH
ncbi:MAG: alkaline phosphatase family protein, partial [Candidatus Heimdallarchaeota archaeon]|nr:alkaline phosphatase family protein [Candidatus Heimdallarchaeota archaeon]